MSNINNDGFFSSGGANGTASIISKKEASILRLFLISILTLSISSSNAVSCNVLLKEISGILICKCIKERVNMTKAITKNT